MGKRSESTRREFLSGQAAGRAVTDAIEDAAAQFQDFVCELFPPSEQAEATGNGYVLTFQRRAMACDFEIRMNADKSADDPNSAALAALDEVDRLESQLTVYRDSSEVQTINQRAADDWVDVEAGLFELLEYSGQLHQLTGGAFDITGGPLSKVWGFFERSGRMPTEEEIANAMSQVGWQHVELDSAEQRIRINQPETEINLNSCGKGYALDCAGDLLFDHGVTDFLFHGGRSTLLASGCRAGREGWTVNLRHPLRPKLRIASFLLKDQALSTSGSATQSFLHRGRRYGHLIDPRTGWPAEGLLSATVVAPTATEADALSTAFYVMGVEATQQFCANRPEIKALLVSPSERNGEVDVTPINFEPRGDSNERTQSGTSSPAG